MKVYLVIYLAGHIAGSVILPLTVAECRARAILLNRYLTGGITTACETHAQRPANEVE